MTRMVFRMTCLLLTLAVQHGVQTAARKTQTNQSWRKEVMDELHEIKKALKADRSSCDEGLGKVVAQMQKQIVASNSAMSSMKAEFQLKLQKAEEELQAVKEKLQAGNIVGQTTHQGSTFVRWGRKTCPVNTTWVYTGVAAGKQYNEKGSGTNSLCVTRSPKYDNTTVTPSYGHLYGSEYGYIPNLIDEEVPCSVCRAHQATTIMIAGTYICPKGWTAQYTGQLTSTHTTAYATEYLCLDGKPDKDKEAKRVDNNGLLFFYVITKCGSLPCPPYKDRKVVTCVVCSM